MLNAKLISLFGMGDEKKNLRKNDLLITNSGVLNAFD